MAYERSTLISGFRLKLVILLIRLHIFWIVFRHQKRIAVAIKTIGQIKQQIKKYRGSRAINKLALVDGKYYWDMFGEGWPTNGFVKNVTRECDRINMPEHSHVGMRNVIFAITTRCPLKCEHCFEWENVHTPESLSITDLIQITQKLIDYGVGQIHLSGGEPMARYDDLISLLNHFKGKTKFWLYTSGYNLNYKTADELKSAGLTGVSVSLDFPDSLMHNNFRHYPKAFEMAQNAMESARCVGLVVTASLCVTHSLLSDKTNLYRYAELVKTWGASFIQLLEPRETVKFNGSETVLINSEKEQLHKFFARLAEEPDYASFPIVIYHEFYRPTLGCRGAGNGMFYIDPTAGVHPCPFCRNQSGNLITDSVEDCVDKLKVNGCLINQATLQKDKIISKVKSNLFTTNV